MKPQAIRLLTVFLSIFSVLLCPPYNHDTEDKKMSRVSRWTVKSENHSHFAHFYTAETRTVSNVDSEFTIYLPKKTILY